MKGALTRALPLIAAVLCAPPADAQTQDVRRGLIAILPETTGLREGDKEVLMRLFQAQTTTFPVGSSSGGFTWDFNPQLGVPTRRSRSFGPMFAERPETIGRHQLSFSLGYQRTPWEGIAGVNLRDGIQFTRWEFLEGRWVNYRSSFTLTTEQTVGTATFGLFDRVDVGVRVPFIRQTLKGTLESDGSLCSGCVDGPGPITGSSEGMGDVTIRSKVMLPSPGIDLAVGMDLRLPTGDEQRLLGSGGKQFIVVLIGGGRTGEIASHFNVGFTFAGSGLPAADRFVEGDYRPSNEFDYTVGTEFTVSTPLTIAADLIGRTLFKAPKPFMFSDLSIDAAGLTTKRATVTQLLGAVSAKYMIADNWLLTAAIAFPLNDSGIKPGLTPVLGFERAF